MLYERTLLWGGINEVCRFVFDVSVEAAFAILGDFLVRIMTFGELMIELLSLEIDYVIDSFVVRLVSLMLHYFVPLQRFDNILSARSCC